MSPKKQHDNNKSDEDKMGSRPPDPRGPAPLDDMYQYNVEQREEFDVLASIYQDDFQKVKGENAAWQAHQQLAYTIRLQADNDPDVVVKIAVELPQGYPKLEPQIKIILAVGVHSKALTRIRSDIKQIPRSLIGSVSIYNVCDAILSILEEVAERKASQGPVPSLEEERKAKKAAAQKAAEEKELELRRQEERQRAEEEMLLEKQLKAERAKQEWIRENENTDSQLTDSSTALIPGLISFHRVMRARDFKTKNEFTFNKVCGNAVLLQRKDKTVTIVTPVVKEDIMVPELLLKDIRLRELLSDTKQMEKTMRGVEELLEATKDYRHANIVDLLGYSIRRLEMPSGDSSIAAMWEISVLSEYAKKGSLRDHLIISGSLNGTVVRKWAHQLLEALEFFDKQGYVHPAVHSGNVLIFLSAEGETTVKLSDGYGTALRTLVVQGRAQEGPVALEKPFWTPSEMLGQDAERTNKSCIWDLGVVILQMVLGIDVTEAYTSPSDCIDGNDFTATFEQVLEKMFHANPKKRSAAFDLQNLAFFRESSVLLFENESSGGQVVPIRRHRQSNTVTSRYSAEFEELAILGKGGFGQVAKARNRFDGRYYAVKKVLCKSRQDLDQMLAEARLLSRLNHPSVVRYFNTWDEKEHDSAIEDDFSSNGRSEEETGGYGDSALFSVGRSGLDFMMEPSYYNEAVGIQFGLSDPGFDSADEGAGQEQNYDEYLSSDKDPDQSDPQIAHHHRKNSSRGYETRPERSTLYMQMELCENQTLRNLLPILSENVEENWRIFRQIVDGLAHIHQNHIVHRDLKPDNIFIDSSNNPRIGDFGLARTGQVSATARPNTRLVASKDTISIGTPFYVAPELRTQGEHEYTSKVDMYSLGIILYEMCYPMKTYMERHQSMNVIGQPKQKLPERFKDPTWAAQGRIISRLLSHVQDERPSAAELLASGEIPEPVEEEKLKRYVESMATTNPDGYRNLLAKFFNAPVSRPRELAWESLQRDEFGADETILSVFVNEKLETVFRHHGATRTDRQGVFPKSEHYTGAATYLEKSGMVVQLPYDLTLPYARMIASGKPRYPIKTYTFGSVYRAAPTSTQPIQGWEVDYDHVSQRAGDIGIKEAEVIKVLDEVIEAFPELRSKSWDIFLNHSDLLDLILNFCQIKPEQHGAVKAVLSTLHIGKSNWQQIHDELRASHLNIMETSVNALARFNFCHNIETTTNKLLKIFDHDPRLSRLLARMDELIVYIKRFRTKAKIYISPLSNYSEYLYRGSIMFQCIDSANRNLLAVGGRYDDLIKSFRSGSGASAIRAVGFRLKVSDIIGLMKSEIKKPQSGKGSKIPAREKVSTTLPRRCDVLVTSFDMNLRLSACLDIANDLWSHGISAELAEDFSSIEELANAYKHESQLLVVIVRHDINAIGGRSLKVRSLAKKDEAEVRPTDLIAHLKGEIEGRQDANDYKLRRLASVGDGLGPSPEAASAEVVVLTPQYRSKKVNRQAVVDAAIIRRREVAASLANSAPTAAIETSDELLEGMRNTRLADGDSWRAFIHSAPAQEGRYLLQVQNKLKEWAGEGKKGAFVFNHRTRGCIYYDFGKTL